MSLTYQPFANTPGVQALGHELRMNVSDPERAASGLLGVGILATALARGGFARWALFVAAGALIRRAVTGRCPLYQHLHVDQRHGHSAS